MVAMANDRSNLLFIEDGVFPNENIDEDTSGRKQSDKNSRGNKSKNANASSAVSKLDPKQPMNVILLK